MAGFMSMKMKRKEYEDVYDEFSDFSLSSPARKTRRLLFLAMGISDRRSYMEVLTDFLLAFFNSRKNVDLPPIIEEEEPAIPRVFGQSLPDEHPDVTAGQSATGMDEITPSLSANEERALVLYKPVNTPLLQSSNSANVTFTVNTEWFPGFKNHTQWFWSGHSNTKTGEVDEASMDGDGESASTNWCLAVVPWVPTDHHPVNQQERRGWDDGNRLSERMEDDDDEMDVATMEVEEENPSAFGGETGGAATLSAGVEGMTQQWQQQHCMTPQIPQNNSTPIMWSW